MRPDVAVVDVHLPNGGGRAIIERVLAEWPDAVFLALSVSDAADDVVGVIRAGARGYVTKTIDADQLVDAIHRVHGGDAVFSPRLAGFVLDAFSAAPPTPVDPALDQLSNREQEVMRLIARGYTYREVADAAAPLGEDHRDPRLGGAAQAAAVQPPRAHRVGHRPPPALMRRSPANGGPLARRPTRETQVHRTGFPSIRVAVR